MNIIVCIKQVPGTAQVEIDPATGVLKRDGVESKMNPYDLYALETALRFKQSHGAEITAVTMGPPQAESVIREAFMMGADSGFILSDRRFGGADVLATSYTLAQGVRRIGDFDLIICGKQTTDGDTAQVGAELAEFLTVWERRCLPKEDVKFLSRTLMTREERLRSEDMGGYYRVAADNRDLNYDKFVVKGEVHTMADESYTSHNTNRLDVEGTVKKIMTTEYVQNELKGIPNV